MTMSDKEKEEWRQRTKSIEPTEVVEHSTIVINKKRKKGILKYTRLEYPATQEGRFASWIQAADEAKKKTDREKLFESVEALENWAQSIAVDEGCEGKSTLETIKTRTVLDDGEVFEGGYEAGSKAKPHTLLAQAYSLEKIARSVRQKIEHFEKYNDDYGDRHRFYLAMKSAVELASEAIFLTLKQHELEILRGIDANYKHQGASTSTQREAVRAMERLISLGTGVNKAAEQIGKEFKVAPSTVKGWRKAHRK